MRIACPNCAWEPSPGDRWSCACGHDWNTFETGGQCPACKTVWRDTQCLACQKWSKHHDWYHDLPPVDHLLYDVAETSWTLATRAASGAGFTVALSGRPEEGLQRYAVKVTRR